MPSKKKLRKQIRRYEHIIHWYEKSFEDNEKLFYREQSGRIRAERERDQLRDCLNGHHSWGDAGHAPCTVCDAPVDDGPRAQDLFATGGIVKTPKFGEPGTYTINNEQAA